MPAGWTEPELWYFDDKANSTNLGQSQPWAFLKPWEGKKEVPNTNPACTSLLSAIEEEPISRLLRPENAVCRTEIYALLQERYNTLALSMTFLVGLLQLIMGSVGLDFLTHFLSTSVLSGFFNGAALIIALSQVGPLLGFATGRRTTLQDLFLGFVKGLARSRPAHALISTLWVAILLLFKFLGKRYARLRVMRYGGPLVVLLLSVATFEWGDVRGPHQSMDFAEIVLRPQATSIRGLKLWAELLPGAIATALVSLVATIQTGPKRERPHYSHPAAEYRALGLSNLLGSFFHGFVVARSQARTEVATQAGASSPLAGLFSGVVVGAFIFALFPLYGRFQKHAIAAIVFSSAAGLMDLTVMRRLWRVSKKDFFTWLLCFLVSIFAGLRFGLITAVGTALLIVIYHITYPNTAVLGRIPGTTVYRDVKDFSDARCVDQVLIVRVSAPMFFANMQFVRDKIAEEVDAAMHRAVLKGTRVEFLLLELSPVTRVDATALASLREIWEELDTIDVVLVLVNPNLEVMRSLHASGVAELIGREFIFVRCHDAVRYCLAKLDFLRDVENIEEATSYGIG